MEKSTEYIKVAQKERPAPNMVLVLKYGESNAMGSALNTWQMPQTVR